MPKINVYLSDDLAAAVKAAELPVSAICQSALETAVRNVKVRGDVTTALVRSARAGPFERMTARARQSVDLAEVAATAHHHNYIGTEHLLLGLLDQGENLGVKVLEAMDLEPADLRQELVASLPKASPMPAAAEALPFTPLAITTFELAVRSALGLGHNYIGGEHLLLGLVDNADGLAAQVLTRMGAEPKATRRAVVAALSGYVQAKNAAAAAERSSTDEALAAVMTRLDAVEARLAEKD
jgi:ATP-dependent Clp protease ATP-binding subunit ClpA